MSWIISWAMGFTKIGKCLKSGQAFLDGKKQMIASLIAALTATATILIKFGDEGTPYLMGVAQTVEFATASAGWIGFFNAMKGEKIRKENQVILDNQAQIDLNIIGRKPE